MTMPPKDLQPELALIARMKQGEEDAFVELYRRHRDGVYRLALMYSGSTATAADVTQETFVFFMTQPNHYDPLRGTLAAWLCGIDIGTVRSRLSRARAQLAQRLALHASDAQEACS